MSLPFVHLRVHSDYSLGRGASKVKDVVKRAKALGQPAVALTDTENLHGAFYLSKLGPDEGVQPLVGAVVYLPVAKKSDERGSVILLAQSARGYANVCRLVNMDLTPDRPRGGVIDADMLRAIAASIGTDDDMTEGVLFITGSGADSFLGKVVEKSGKAAAAATARFFMQMFGDRFYVEVCRNGHPNEAEVAAEKAVLETALEIGAPVVATTDAWYADEGRHDAFVLLKAVAANEKASVVASDEGLQLKSPIRYHMRSNEEMWELFRDLPEAYDTASEIARRSAFKVEKRDPILPPFQTEGGRTEAEELRIQARAGLERRLAKLSLGSGERDAYFARMDYELGVIAAMGFPGYFLIVSDFIKFSKTEGIPVGPGRGSGAGSVVAWALTITDLNPLRFGLLFERFLNPERVSMPDFDIDFCQDRREEVIHYVERKYGRAIVAQIATFTEMKAKSSLKDVARVIMHPEQGGMSQMEINNLTNMVPEPKNGVELKLKEVYDQVPDFQQRVNDNARSRLVYDYALKVEGLYRNVSSHAAGVIIAGETLTKLVPVGFDAKTGFPLVQFNMKDAEAAGLVKFDFLGLKTLSVLKEALAQIDAVEGVRIDLEVLPFDDAKTLDIFARAQTTGVFQFESEGMKKALLDVKPDRIEDLIAVNALYRPGPMDYIPSYAKRKAGSETPTYYTPVDKTKPYLEETYGIMVYQEQVMQVAQVVAGYSLGGADLLRRAMGKKIKAEMDAQKSKFVEGALATNGIHEREAVSIFESIEAFANYGFNKSHAAAYSVIAYHTAYLKAHHPVSFYAGLLSYEDKAERMALVKQDMDQFGIEFLSPDVNRSHGKFRAERREDGSLGLRFGLTAIKGVSESVVAPMVAERESGGPFKDLIDFHQRAGKHFNSAQLQKLAEAGAFVSVNPEGNRRQSFEILSFLSKNDKRDATMADIFGGAAKIVVRQNVLDTLEWNGLPDLEYNAVGFYFRSHPIDAVEKKLAKARLIKRRQTVIDFMVAKKEDYRRDINLLGMVEECFINQGSRGPFNKVKLGERQQTYMINIYPREQEVDEVHRLLEGAKKSRKPVVVRADFSPGHNGPGDMFVRGTKMWNLDQFLDEFNPPRRWGVEIDQSELDIRGDEAFRVGEIHARAKAGPPPGADPAGFEDDCMREMSEAVAPKMTFAMKMFAESFQSLSREVARESEADSVEITAVVRAGPYKRKFQFDKIIPPRYSITNNAVTAVACYAVTSFKEIE